MCTSSDLETLAKEVCLAAKTIEAYRHLQGCGPVTFDSRSDSPLIPRDAPQHIHEAKQAIIENSTRIQQLAVDSADVLPRLAVNYQQLACIQWLCQFHIISCVPLNGSIRYSEAASLCSVPENQLRSVARMAIATNFLREVDEGTALAHNAVSAAFVRDPGLTDWVLFMTGFSMPVASKFVDATKKWGASKRKNETAVNLALGTDLPLFDFIKQSPDLTRQFASYMENMQRCDGMSVRHLAAAYDWEKLGDAKVVDIGGSTGAISVQLATKFPRLSFVVRDLEAVASQSASQLQSQPESIRKRVQFQAHNFFEPQPAKGADVFLMRRILHDWPADEAVKILRNMVPALRASKRDARLLIQDTVLPVPGSIDRTQEALLRVQDLTMMQSFNSKERELGEFAELLKRASPYDGKLVLKAVHTPPGSLLSVIEVAFEQLPNGVLVGDDSGVEMS